MTNLIIVTQKLLLQCTFAFGWLEDKVKSTRKGALLMVVLVSLHVPLYHVGDGGMARRPQFLSTLQQQSYSWQDAGESSTWCYPNPARTRLYRPPQKPAGLATAIRAGFQRRFDDSAVEGQRNTGRSAGVNDACRGQSSRRGGSWPPPSHTTIHAGTHTAVPIINRETTNQNHWLMVS